MKTTKNILSAFFLCLVTILMVSGNTMKAQAEAITTTLKMTADWKYDEVQGFLDELNRQRAARGLGELKLDNGYTNAAMERACETVLYSAHERPDLQGIETLIGDGSCSVMENISAGNYTTKGCIDDWGTDGGHAAAMFNSNIKYCGIGIIKHCGFYHRVLWTSKNPSGVSASKVTYTVKRSLDIRVKAGDRVKLNVKRWATGIDFGTVSSNEDAPFYIPTSSLGGGACIADIFVPDVSCLTFSGYDSSIISVSPSGDIYPKKKGSTTITVRINGNPALTSTVPITVKALNTATQVDGVTKYFTFELEKVKYDFTGEAFTPKMKVAKDPYGNAMVEGRDYKLEYKNNVYPGTGEVKVFTIGNYNDSPSGSWYTSRYFDIVGEDPKSIYELNSVFADTNKTTATYKYTGKAICPKVVVKDGGKVLKEGVDYSLTYYNNVNVSGKAKVEIEGISYAYTGFKSLYFSITNDTSSGGSSSGSSSGTTGGTTGSTTKPSTGTTTPTTTKPSTTTKPATTTPATTTKPATTSKPAVATKPATSTVKKNPVKVTLSKTSMRYTGKTQKPKVTVTYNGKKLSTKYYTVKYKNNKNPGVATITITGKGSYKGKISEKKTFIITPKKVSIKNPSVGKGTFTAKWSKHSGVTGYQVLVSKNKSFSAVVARKNVKGTSLKVSKLSKKTTYYTRVRAYKTVNGKTYYGPWSSVKSKKTK